jgi:quinol monooxygenase YgiN
VPQKQADTVMLYELYASPEAFEVHRTGASLHQMKRDTEELQASLVGVYCDPLE